MQDGKFHPHTEYKKGTRKSRDQSVKTEGVVIRKARAKLDDRQKSILRNWVKQNRDWRTIDDLPNEIFIPLISPAKDDIDKRVAIQMQAIEFMKQVTKELNKKERKSRFKRVATGHVLDKEIILQSADGTSLVNYHGSPRYSEKRLKGSLISELQNDFGYNLRTVEALRGQQRVMEKTGEKFDKVGLEHDVDIAQRKNEQIRKELESRGKTT